MLMMSHGKRQVMKREVKSWSEGEKKEPRKYYDEERIIVVNGFGRKSGKID